MECQVTLTVVESIYPVYPPAIAFTSLFTLFTKRSNVIDASKINSGVREEVKRNEQKLQ